MTSTAPQERLEEPLLAEGDELVHVPTKEHVHVAFLTDPHAWYRHPLLRIFILFLVLFMDFFTYGEDPGQDSHIRATSTGTGQIVGLLALQYAPSTEMKVLKFVCLIVALLLAWKLGKLFRDWIMVKLLRFAAFDSDGGMVISYAIMLGVSAFAVDEVYNRVLEKKYGDDPSITQHQLAKWTIDSHSMGFFQWTFFLKTRRAIDLGKMWQWISSTLDWLAIFQIIDSVFQDKKYYPKFCPCFKNWYTTATICGNSVRNLFFFMGFPLLTGCTAWALSYTGNQPGQINWQIGFFGGSDEIVRTLLAAFIVFLDLFCLVQDWEFPLFSEDHHHEDDRAKIAGLDSNEVVIRTPAGPLKLSAKWMQYGPLVGIMGADFAFVKSMFTYTPAMYGEYTDPRDHTIWVVVNETFLDYVYPLGSSNDTETLKLINFWERHTCDNTTPAVTKETHCELLPSNNETCPGCDEDTQTTSRFLNSGLDKLCAMLAVLILAGFLLIVRVSMNEALEEEIAVWGQDGHEALKVEGAGVPEVNGHYEHARDPKAPSGTYTHAGADTRIVHNGEYWRIIAEDGSYLYSCKSASRVCPLNEDGSNPNNWVVDKGGREPVPRILQDQAMQPLLP